jgi:curved DNA-binding protein CbpA
VRNLYKVLGVASKADDQRIKSAFRRRAMRTHPDLNPGSRRAGERFREVVQAYQVLRNAEARAAYDAHLARRRSDARRRFAQSAAVMMVTFALTTTSILAVGLQGISVHSETWQIATKWLTSVKVEPKGAEALEAAPFTTTVVASTGEHARVRKARPPSAATAQE